MSMLNNYFKVGIRNVRKYKVFSFINVISGCIRVILMLDDQKSYDQSDEAL